MKDIKIYVVIGLILLTMFVFRAEVENETYTLVKKLEHVYNIRYNGYTENDKAIIESIFSEELSDRINTAFMLSEKYDSVDITDIVNNQQGNRILLDRNIVEKNGVYKVYLEGLKVIGNIGGAIIGETIYKINMSDYNWIKQYKNDPSYFFQLKSYNYFNSGTLIVEFTRGGLPVLTLEEYLKKYKSRSELDYRYEVLSRASEKAVRLVFNVGMNGKISYIKDINNIIGEI